MLRHMVSSTGEITGNEKLGLEVLEAGTMKMSAFWVESPCSLQIYKHLREMRFLQVQDRRIRQ
jgi:hypothetical protein